MEALDAGSTLAAVLRRRLPGRSWNDVRALVARGKITVAGSPIYDPAMRLTGGERIDIRLAAPAPVPDAPTGFRVAFEDTHMIVIEKPAGVSSVPYERKETGTAMDLVRDAWRRAGRRATATPLYVVHRIDKDTSGLLCFAKTRLGERGLHRIFQRHEASREYVAVAQGDVPTRRIESAIAADRGDGIRGTLRRGGGGQRAVTWVEAVERIPGVPAGGVIATVCRVRLETGRTHQIRIHLSEAGHPVLGETVYVRDLIRAGGTPVPSSRLMLHAATLELDHPVSGARVALRAAPPPDFADVLARLRHP